MPTIYTEVEVDIVDILQDLSKRDKQELLEELLGDLGLDLTRLENRQTMSDTNIALDKIAKNEILLTDAEEEYIKQLASRFL
jgi:hypothetical protein